jgi:predicted Zn-dependent protease
VFRYTFLTLLLISASAAGVGQELAQETKKPAPTAEAQPVSEEVAAAEAAIAQSDWRRAEAELGPWLATHPVDARALFDAGYAADEQNRLDDAATYYRRATMANPQLFEAHVEYGMLLARQDKPDEAREELTAATELDPGSAGAVAKARAWRALARIEGADDPAKASQDLLEALKLSPETNEDTLFAANLADRTGQNEAAEKAYRLVLATDPKSAPANAGLAHLLIARKQYPEAETFLRAALVQSPNDTALTAQLATVLAAQDKAEALPLFEKLHADHPKETAITRMLAQVLADAGDAAGSDKLYAELLVASPEDPDLLVAHGQNLTRQLKNTEAFAVFDKATRLDPANADGWSGLAFAASRIGQPSVALHALAMRSRYLPEVPSTYFIWAISYDALHDKAAAATYYHHFLDSAAGKYPNQEWQARQRLILLESKK